MPHPLVTQLRFTRSEWIRGLKPVTAEEAAARRFGPVNPIAWMIGHLAWQVARARAGHDRRARGEAGACA